MTLPMEIRLEIWKRVIPEEIELKGVEYLPPHSPLFFSEASDGTKTFPRNPLVPLLLINRKANCEVSTLPQPTLTARFHALELDDWLMRCGKLLKQLFGRVNISSAKLHTIPERQCDKRLFDLNKHNSDHTEEVLGGYFKLVQRLYGISAFADEEVRTVDYDFGFQVGKPLR